MLYLVNVSANKSTLHCITQFYQFGQFFVLNHRTFISSTVLQETHVSCDQHPSNLVA